MATAKPFGIDVSRWQGKIDWDIIAQHDEPVLFAGIRASINWGYTDSWFEYNWTEAKRVGIFRCAYHVVYPETSAEKQIDYFLSIVGDDTGELPLVLDVELDHGKSTSQISTTVLQCATLIKERTGKNPMIYSRSSWIDTYITGSGTPPSWLNNYDWWLALYLSTGAEHAGPPTLPKGVVRERCLIHQTTAKGAAIGVESKSLDYNRWQFDEEHLTNYAGGKASTYLTMEEKVELLWQLHPELHNS